MICKQLLALSALVFALIAAPSIQANPLKVPAYFKTMYVPGGYDSNDVIQIVGEGTFHNSCFRQAQTSVRVDEQQRKVFLGPVAFSYPGICLMVISQYQKTVEVGILKPGKWEIIQETDKKTVGEINVHQAKTESADEYLYAPISQAFFYQIGERGRVLVTGTFMNSCLRLDEVKITVEPNVIAVQPLAVMEQRSDCKDGVFPFAKDTRIEQIPAGRYLLHVRSLNANAINSIIDVN